MVNITLTEEQANMLIEILEGIQDEGPLGEGWASEKVDKLRCFIWQQIVDQF